MAAVLAPQPQPRRPQRRPAARLLTAAVALFLIAAVVLGAAVLHTGRAELRLGAWARGGQPGAQPEAGPAQQRWLERQPPLPTGEAARAAGGDDDDPLAALGPDYIGEDGAVHVVHAPQRSGSGSSSRFSGVSSSSSRFSGGAAAAGEQPAQPAASQPPGNAAAAEGGAAGTPAAAVAAGEQQVAPPDGACSKALGIKKVALLFLTTRRLAHERLWRLWLWDAAHVVPLQVLPALQGGLCSSGSSGAAADGFWDQLRHACSLVPPVATPTGLPPTELPPQHLFSVYAHAPPDYQGLEYQPLFVGRVVPNRFKTGWGDISILDAEKALLREALRDPLNEKFALISDSDIPLYDPLTFYQQLMHEPHSRVRACARGWMNRDRWRDEMATPHMNASHWRKSNQFFGLTRRHAELVLADTEAEASFRDKCGGWYPHLNQWKECIADEHYVPTLLASLGLENETYCGGWGLAYTDWSDNWIHPKSFRPRDVAPELINRMRWNCENMTQAVEDSRHMFIPLEPLLAAATQQQACQQLQAPMPPVGAGANSSDAGSSGAVPLEGRRYARPIDGACPLTARKLPAFTALRVRQLFLASCPNSPSGFVESQASLVFPPDKDPNLVLLRGPACTADIQRQVLAPPLPVASGLGGAAAAAGRRLLCAAQRYSGGAAAEWLPDVDWGDWCN